MSDPKYYVYGNGGNQAPMKVRYKDDPLPEDLNVEAEEIAGKFGYAKLVEIVKNAKKMKRYGSAHFYLNGIEVAKFDFWFGICMRVIFAQGDIGDSYQDVKDKLSGIHGKLIPVALFMRSLVPESISTKRPFEASAKRIDKRSEGYKQKYLNGEV
jgi:hypothetical protein